MNDGDEMVVLPTSPTSAVPGGDTCVTGSCLERRRASKLSSSLDDPQTPGAFLRSQCLNSLLVSLWSLNVPGSPLVLEVFQVSVPG